MLPAMVEQERREKLRRVSTEKLIHRVSDRVDASHHGPVLMPDEGPSKTSTLLAAGAISGGVSKLLTAPIDRIKIIYQVNTDPRHAFTLRRGFSTASNIVLQSGVLALWRGNSAAVARDVLGELGAGDEDDTCRPWSPASACREAEGELAAELAPAPEARDLDDGDRK